MRCTEDPQLMPYRMPPDVDHRGKLFRGSGAMLQSLFTLVSDGRCREPALPAPSMLLQLGVRRQSRVASKLRLRACSLSRPSTGGAGLHAVLIAAATSGLHSTDWALLLFPVGPWPRRVAYAPPFSSFH